MKLKICFLIGLLCACLCFNSCANQSNNPDDNEIKRLKSSVTEFLKTQFILAPTECIEYVKFDEKKDCYELYVDFNPLELYPELYDEGDDVYIYEKTVFVQEIDDGYAVFDEDNEYTYYVRRDKVDSLNNGASETASQYNEFNLSEYRWEIDNFPSTKKVGEIRNAEEAIEAAKKLWIEEFSVINGEPNEPINGLPIEVFYDAYEDCWLINGTLEQGENFIVYGAVPIAIIKSDGSVIAVWYG